MRMLINKVRDGDGKNINSTSAEPKVTLPKSFSSGNFFGAYGRKDDFLANAAYIGHFIIIINEFSSLNYFIFRRCINERREKIDREYFSYRDEHDRRDKTKELLLILVEKKGMGNDLKAEILSIYNAAQKFFNEMKKGKSFTEKFPTP